MQRTKIKFVAQSGENNSSHREINTLFYDSSVPHEDKEGEKNMMESIPPAIYSVMPVDYSAVLNRPYLLGTYTWSSANVIRAGLFNVIMPQQLLDITNITDKLDFIQYIRPDMELEIQINGTKFHYGRVIIPVRPMVTGLDNAYQQPEGSSTWPVWHQISANSQQSVKISLPWKCITRHMQLHTTQNPFYQMYNLAAYVAVPLSNVNTATPPSVTISVYGRFIDAKPHGFCPSFTAQSAEELMGMMSLGTTSNIIDRPKNLGGLVSNVATKVSEISRDVALVAKKAGYSIPINPAPTTSMQLRQPLFAKADDMPNSINLGPSQTANLTLDSSLVNAPNDDMSLVKLVTQPALITTSSITSTNVANDVLWNMRLTPRNLVYSDYSYAPSGGIFQATMPYYIGRMFRLWRGGFKIHISFVASGFHSCRVRLMWVPSIPAIGTVLPITSQEVGNSYNVVMDINKQTEYSIQIPYFPLTDWLEFADNSLDATFNCNGQVIMVLQTPLTSLAATVTPIYYQVFVSMSDDAQFAAPSLIDCVAFGNPNYSVTFNEDDDDDVVLAQSSETLLCELPSSSSTCLRDTKFVNIAGDDYSFARNYGESTAYEFASVKQLTNMLTPLINQLADPTHNYNGFNIMPFGVHNQTYNDMSWYNYYSQIRSIYRFGRGSVRVVGLSSGVSLQCSANLEPVAFTPSTNIFTTQNDRFPLLTTGDTKYVTAGYQYIANASFQPLDVTIPYYSTLPCQRLNSVTTFDFIPNSTSATLSFSTQGTTPALAVLIATGDDFEFGTQISVPTLKKFP